MRNYRIDSPGPGAHGPLMGGGLRKTLLAVAWLAGVAALCQGQDARAQAQAQPLVTQTGIAQTGAAQPNTPQSPAAGTDSGAPAANGAPLFLDMPVQPPAPSPVAPPPQPSAAPARPAPATAAPAIVATGIQVQQLAAPNPDSIGILTTANGGFDAALWKGSDAPTIAGMIEKLPQSYSSPVLRDLARRVLLTTADAPVAGTGASPGRTLDSLRLETLAHMGNWADADVFAAAAGRRNLDDEAIAAQAQADLLADQAKNADKVCAATANEQLAAKAPFWAELGVFCKARSGDQVGATLALELMRDAAGRDTPFTLLASYALGETELPGKKDITAVSPAGLALLAETGKLDLAVFSAIEDPQAKAFAAQIDGGHSAEGLRLAEDAARAGLLGGNQLADLYVHGPEVKSLAETKTAAAGTTATDSATARAALYRDAALENDPARKIEAIGRLVRAMAAHDGGDLTGTAGEMIADVASGLARDLPHVTASGADAAAIALVYLARQMPDAARPWLQAAGANIKDDGGRAIEALRPLAMLDALAGVLPPSLPPAAGDKSDASAIAILQRQADAFALLGLLNTQGAREALTAILSRMSFDEAARVPDLTIWHGTALASAIARQAKGEAILAILDVPEPAPPDASGQGADAGSLGGSLAGHTVWAADTARALMAFDMRNEARAVITAALVDIAEADLAARP